MSTTDRDEDLPTKQRPIRFNCFLSVEEKDMLDQISEGLGLTASATIRTLIRDAMQDFSDDEDQT